jgi:hypothetical protein
MSFNPSCAEPAATNCRKQLWEIASVPNRPGVYTLTNRGNNLMLSYNLSNEGRDVSTNLTLLQPLPRSQRELQFFYVTTEEAIGGRAIYSIRPFKTENATNRIYYYVAARKSSMNWDNCPVEIEYREEKLIDAKENVLNVLFTFTPITNIVNVAPSQVLPIRPSGTSNATLNVTFGTGGDNLEGGNNNVDITIRFKSSDRVLFIGNVNQTKKLNNFTTETFTREIPNSANIPVNDIKEIEIRHTGGGGMFADNWHVDKIYIVINNGFNKVLLDKVGKPIHMFTGESRVKRFQIE